MATTVARLQAILDADTRQFDQALGRSQTKTQRFGNIAKAALVGGAAAGLYAFGKAAKIGWDEFNQGQQVAAQTNAVLKSTGGVANVTAQGVEDLGKALMLKSGIDDEVIKSGENVLLTFTNIRNEAGRGNKVFDQATKLALDLSVALGQDMQSSAIQLGKALNDPVKGITALQRVGVSFTQSQRDMIARLVESGNTMKAQKVILAELNKEFGGSAEAAGKTFGGQLNILRERLNNFLGDLTAKAIPLLQAFIKWVGPKLSEALKRTRELTDTWRNAINQMSASLQKHQGTLQAVKMAVDALSKIVSLATRIWLFWARIIATVWVKEVQIAIAIVNRIISVIRILGNVAKTVGNVVAAAFRVMLAPILTVINAVQKLVDLLNKVNPFSGGTPDPGPGSSGGRFGRTTQRVQSLTPRVATSGGTTVNIARVYGTVDESFYQMIRDAERRHRFRGGS